MRSDEELDRANGGRTNGVEERCFALGGIGGLSRLRIAWIVLRFLILPSQEETRLANFKFSPP